MKHFWLGLFSSAFLFCFNHGAFAVDLSGTYLCHGWDESAGEFKDSVNVLKLKMTEKDHDGHEVQGYQFMIKDYGSEKDIYKGFGITNDGIHMSLYFNNTDNTVSNDYGNGIIDFKRKNGTISYSGNYYQPVFEQKNKSYNYGLVMCKKEN